MAKEKLEGIIRNAINKAIREGRIPSLDVGRIELERPKRKEHGDWATNIALVLAPGLGIIPHEFALTLVGLMEARHDVVSKVEVAGPGFINFHLAPEFIKGILFEISQKGPRFGSSGVGGGKRVQIEFVSANPVGPLHVGHGRWAALGDCLANVMEHAGYSVEREFYVNDYGTQMLQFGRSISARYMELQGRVVEWPDGGYAGEYIKDIARRISSEHGSKFVDMPDEERSKVFAEIAYPWMLSSIRSTLEKMRVRFDNWASERELHEKGKVVEVIEELERNGQAYRKDGALWLRTSTYGDEKDRVLIRSNGEPTYFASDIAYHRDKISRNFDLLINIWGADHHGYVSRMKAAFQELGFESERLEIILGQLVKLYRSGEPVTMSKRTGEIITLDELLDEVGVDAARYFFLQRSSDSPLDFDIELAKRESPENPVYYVQYAHARISSILRYAKDSGVEMVEPSEEDVSLLSTEQEIELIKKLSELEELVELCAEKRAPHRLTTYAEELASIFHIFYRDCRVVTDDEALTRARLFLVKCTRQVLQIVLGLLGVTAPERM